MSSQPTLPKGTDLDSFRNPTPTRKPPKRASAKTRTPSVEDLIDEKLHQKQNVGRVAEVTDDGDVIKHESPSAAAPVLNSGGLGVEEMPMIYEKIFAINEKMDSLKNENKRLRDENKKLKQENARLLSDPAADSQDVPGPLGGWTPNGSGSRDRNSKLSGRSATTEPDRPYLRAATGQEDGRVSSASLDPTGTSGAPSMSPQHVYAARMAASTDRSQPTSKGGGRPQASGQPKKSSFLKRGTGGGGGGSFSNSRQVKQDSEEQHEARILEDEEPGEGGSLGTPSPASEREQFGLPIEDPDEDCPTPQRVRPATTGNNV